jgi:hypothetical protein
MRRATSCYHVYGRRAVYKGGKICDSKHCKLCMAVGGSWVKCRDAAKFAVRVNGANDDLARPKAVLFALALISVPIAVFYFLGRRPAQPSSDSEVGADKPKTIDRLLRFASAPWFPLIAALATGINMFTIIFTGATVILYLSAILGNKSRWVYAAVANAAGATGGTAVLLLLVRERGVGYLNESFPTLLASPAWAKAMAWMNTYGIGGMFM